MESQLIREQEIEESPQFVPITQNDFLGRKQKKLVEEDIAICECKYDASNAGSTCGESCLNVLTNTECTPGYCPYGEHCGNQKFQKCEYVKTRLFKTEGRGWGLLADQSIKAGQFIIEYCGEVISSEEAKGRSQNYQDQGLKDAYIISLDANYFIDATKKGSLARFINHSCEPNCETRKWTVLGETRVGIFAKKDIVCGTELSYDYNFEWFGGATIRCLCRAANCSLFLGAKSHGFQLLIGKEFCFSICVHPSLLHRLRILNRLFRESKLQILSMAAKPQKRRESTKRKRIPHQKSEGAIPNPKRPKLASNPKVQKSSYGNAGSKVATKPFKGHNQKPTAKQDDKGNAKKLGGIRAKELSEARKKKRKKRKKHYWLKQELSLLWEKMRRRDISKEDRSKLVSDALNKMKGKVSEIASSHVSSRVLQTCVKYCTRDEGNTVFVELRPHLLSLACNTYAVHLVTKMLDRATKEQLSEFISSLHGHVASLLRNMVGSLVIEHAYKTGNATQRQALLLELYSPELQLFKDFAMKENRLLDVISKLKLQTSSVSRHMTSVLQPIVEKGILDHSIVHRALMEYLSIADKFSATDIIQQLSGPSLVRMIHTEDGSRLGMLCVRHGSAKERKKIIKGMKGHVSKIAHDKFGSMVLVCIFSVVDDTKLVSKIIIRELEENMQELLLDQNARRPLLHLLHPNCSLYLGPDYLKSLSDSIPSLKNKGESDDAEAVEEDKSGEVDHSDANIELNEGGKKDSVLRRQELLVNSGLAEKLVDVCCETVENLLRSKYGKEVLYEVATGGANGVLRPNLDEKLHQLHEAIASIATHPKTYGPGEDHILENFHSSRAIRKLVLDCPEFASTLWEKALKGKCTVWSKGHSSKVINAYLESSNSEVQELAKEELQPLIDSADLSLPTSEPTKR